VHVRWTETWAPCGIFPQSPTSMAARLRRREQALEKARAHHELRFELEVREQAERALASELARLLGTDRANENISFADLLVRAQTVVEGALGSQQRRETLLALRDDHRLEVGRLEQQIATAAGKTEKWKNTWEFALAAARMPADLSPTGAGRYLTVAREIGAGLKQVADLEHRIAAMEADAVDFGEKVAALAERLIPTVADAEPEVAITQIHEALTKAEQDRALRQQEQKHRREVADKLFAAEQEVVRSSGAVEALCRQTDAADAAAAQECWAQVQRRNGLEIEVAQCEGRLCMVSAGKTVEELVAEALGVDADSIPGTLEERRAGVVESAPESRKSAGARRGGVPDARRCGRGRSEAAHQWLGWTSHRRCRAVRPVAHGYVRDRQGRRAIPGPQPGSRAGAGLPCIRSPDLRQFRISASREPGRGGDACGYTGGTGRWWR